MKSIREFFKEKLGLCLTGLSQDKRLMYSHVERDWIIMLSASILIVICMLIFNIYLFISSNNDVVIKSVPKKESAYFIDRSKMEDVLEFFSKKESVFNDIKNNKTEVPKI